MGSIDNLPEEILLQIFSRFSLLNNDDLKYIRNIKLVCHKWKNIALDSTFAREIIIRPVFFSTKKIKLIWNKL